MGLFPFQIRPDPDHIQHRDMFRDAADKIKTCINPFRRKTGRYINNRCICPCCFYRLCYGVKHRDPQHFFAAATGRYARYDVGAVIQRNLGVEGCLMPGNALYNYFRVFINKYGHDYASFPAAVFAANSTASLAPSSILGAI